jgi:hypothetical protein
MKSKQLKQRQESQCSLPDVCIENVHDVPILPEGSGLSEAAETQHRQVRSGNEHQRIAATFVVASSAKALIDGSGLPKSRIEQTSVPLTQCASWDIIGPDASLAH